MHDLELVEVLVAFGDMDVAVEQPRQKGRSGHVDGFVSVESRSHVDDPAVLERHIGIADRRARAVEDATARQDDPDALLLASCPRLGRLSSRG